MDNSKKILVVITGPTASGKTSMAIEVAGRYGTEIISADSRQIFRDLPIGTAAPTPAELALVPHHLVGVFDLDRYYSAACFEHDAMGILERIWASRPVAVVCGGSMMYVDALLKGIDDMPTVSDSTRAYVLDMLNTHGLETVLAQLRICDPEYYEQVDRSNTRRVVHALEICLESGSTYTSFRTGKPKARPFEAYKFAIDMPRELLFGRINDRVDAMIAAGLENEARQAFAKGNFNSLNTVGYKEMAMMFEGVMDRATAIARIAKNTRVYAKKQLTWLKKDPDVRWIRTAGEIFSVIDPIL